MTKKIFLLLTFFIASVFTKAQVKAYEYSSADFNEASIVKILDESRKNGTPEWEVEKLKEHLYKRLENQKQRMLAQAANQKGIVAPPNVMLACNPACTNMGFDNGSNSGWSVSSADINGVTLPCNTCPVGTTGLNYITTASNSGITWTNGVDNCSGKSVVAPNGGTNSLCLNNNTTGGKMQMIQQKYSVTNTNNILTYQYLAVLEDGGHAVSQQPYFFSQVLDGSGTAIPCTYYLQAASGSAGWTACCTDAYYKGWVTVTLDMTSYIGQCVTIQFLVSDCNQGGHYGYCYIDASCDVEQTNNTVTICPGSTQLCGQSGFTSYAWTGPVTGNTQCLNTSTPGSYILTCTGVCPAPVRHYSVVVSPTPTVNFTSTVTPCNPNVPFTDLTTVSGGGSVSNWSWSMTGASPSTYTSQNPTATYTTTGTFPVVLTCTSSAGCTGTYSTTVTLGTGPTAVFSASTVCPGNPTVFTNTSTGATGGYSWDFGEPASGAANTSTATNPSHTYAGPGNYTATLNAMGTGTCVATKTLTIVVSPVPTATIGAPPVCLGAATTFTSAINPTAGTTYNWNYGDGPAVAGTATPSHTYASANTFPVTVTVTAAGGCTVTATTTVTVNPNPTASISVAEVCQGTSSAFTSTVTNGNAYSWNFGGAGVGTNITGPTPGYVYASSGTFPVTVTVTAVGGCTVTAATTATVDAMPVLSITTTPACDLSAVCFTNNTPAPGTFTVWAWSFGDGIGTSNAAAPPCYTYPAAGIYTVTLTASTATGCSGTVTATAIVHPNPDPSGSIGPNCQFDASTFVDASTVPNPPGINDNITSWLWDFGDGSGTSTQSSPSYTYALCGVYTVSLTVTTNFSCTAVAVGTETVFCLPNVTAPPSFSVCPGTPVTSAQTTFTTTCGAPALGVPVAIYFANNPNPNTNISTTHGGIPIADTSGLNSIPNYNAIAQNLSCGLLIDTIYGFAVTDIGGNIGCVGNVQTFTISVYPTPTVTPVNDQTVCAGANVLAVNFTGCPAGETFPWITTGDNVGLTSPGTGNITTFPGQNPVTPAAAVSTVSVTPTANGCTGPPITFNIIVNPIPTMTVTSPAAYCPGDPIANTDYNFNTNIIGPGLTYSWTTPPNNVGMQLAGVGLAPTSQYNAPANSSQTNQTTVISYTPSMNGCIGPVATNTITVKPTPTMQPMTNQFWCPNANTTAVTFSTFPVSAASTYNWSYTTPVSPVPNQGTSNPFPSLPTLNPGGTPLVVTVTVTPTLNGCVGPPSGFNITVYPNPIPKFSNTEPVCDGKPMAFTDLSTPNTGSITVNQWFWDFDNNGTSDAITQNPTYIYPSGMAGTNTVTLYAFTSSVPSCSAAVTNTVYISPNPVADFVGDSLKSCPQLKTKFTDLSTVTINGVPTGSITSWNWSFGNNNGSSSSTPPQQTYTNSSPTQSAYYAVSLTVTTADGCVNSKTVNKYIQVYPRPIADFGWGPVGADIDDPTIDFVNQSIGASGYPAAHPTVFGAYGVEYYLGDVFAMNQNSNNVYTNAGFSHTYEHYDPYTYYVTQWVVNSLGCKDSITKPVEILPNFTFYIPNAFSPNGDGTNEGFKGTGVGIDNTTYNLWVFDRWGMMIFYADDLEKSWDGHMKGNSDKPVLQEDVYVWKVKFSDFRGKKHEYHGTVTLLK